MKRETTLGLALARLLANRSLVGEFMTHTFTGRRATPDRAQDSGAIQQQLGGIVDPVNSSPFKDLAEFRGSHDDPTFTLGR